MKLKFNKKQNLSVFFISCVMTCTSLCDEITIRINNEHGGGLYPIPFIVDMIGGNKIYPKNINDEQIENGGADSDTHDEDMWKIDRAKISDNFRLIIANGHPGIIQNYVYYKEFKLTEVGETIEINLKAYEINIEVMIDHAFFSPIKSSKSSNEVIVQLSKIDQVGEVSVTVSAEKVNDKEYRKKILLFQPGNYWVQLRYQGGKIKGVENEYLGYPVWGKIIKINDEHKNLKIIGDRLISE